MPYADTTQVKSLMGNKIIYNDAGTDITSTVVTDAINRSDSDVELFTGHEDWVSTDMGYYSVVKASELFAASFILMRYGKNENEINKEAMDYYNMAKELCMLISDNATQSIYISSRAYQSYPINRDTGTIHRSLVGTDSTVNGE